YAVRGALPEHLALVIVPFAFWGVEWIERSPWNGAMLLTLAMSLLLITNPPAAVVVGIGLVVWVLRGRGGPGWTVGALLFAVLLSAFYTLPAYVLRSNVQITRLWTLTPFLWHSPITAIFSRENFTINAYTF